MTRKEFLNLALPTVFLPSIFKGQNVMAFGGASIETNDHILVIVQLQGGNDGLNTVIPIDKYALYKNARSNIAIAENKIIKLTGIDNLGLNPGMNAMAQLYNEGKVNIINGVSYPNPSFSHFRATDIWNSGSSSDETLSSGWAGRYLNNLYPNYPTGFPNSNFPDPLAMQIGSVMPLSLQGFSNSMGMAINNTDSFYNLISNNNGPVPNTYAGKQLDFLRTVSTQSNAYSKSIVAAANKVSKQADYPTNNTLADKLKIVARLIAGGLKTKIYVVNLSGFDTHSSQTDASDTSTGVHATLWQKVSEAISVFQNDIKSLGVSKNVIGFTFSEFGRRIKSNASGGTDHGTGAPMFVFGDMVRPGVMGTSPDIPQNPTVNDNIAMQYDFRSVYASIFERWFCSPKSDISKLLSNNFQSLPIIQGTACNIAETLANNVNTNETEFNNYPNPFQAETTFSFFAKQGYGMIQIFNNDGQLITNTIELNFQSAGNKTVKVDLTNTPAGVYFARFQNNNSSSVRKIVKL